MGSMGKSIYTPELAQRVLDELRKHGSTTKAAKAAGVDRSTIVSWCELFPEFEPLYARAKAEGIDALVEDTIEIADDSSKDYVETREGPKLDSEHVQRSKLRIETRRWYAERLAARKYGVLQKLELTGANGGPVQVDDTTRSARAAQLLAMAERRKAQQQEFGDLA